ncbi:hypothetical protein EVAR_49567_1 [Eumeta japonica]|uniref:Uncharacterized protein n=1 Tax=Eumeta variegata TaxID=151549 RepID=A0A4C1YLC2_EUMVA|nr:hypothetical protein EVAR_49567_1 [Eumeta japonica]
MLDGSKIEKGSKMRTKNETGTKIGNRAEVENECRDGVKIKSGTGIGTENTIGGVIYDLVHKGAGRSRSSCVDLKCSTLGLRLRHVSEATLSGGRASARPITSRRRPRWTIHGRYCANALCVRSKRACELAESRSLPSMDIRKLRGVASMLLASWVGMRYLMWGHDPPTRSNCRCSEGISQWSRVVAVPYSTELRRA